MIFLKKKEIIIGSIFIFLLGSLFHFTYDISNQNLFVGLFSSVNESIFEHTKLIIYPIIIWYIIVYLKNKDSIKKNYYFSSMIVNILISFILIPVLYYSYTCSMGISSLIIDLIIFYISGLSGLTIASKYYYQNINLPWRLLLLIVIILFTVGTYFPPNIPFFLVK